jgi:MFS family permease
VLFLGAFLSFCVRLAPAVALPDLQAAFGLTAAELSLLTAVYLWPFALMQPVAGLLTDTLGPRRSVTIFLIIAGLGQLLLALAPNFALALTGRACTGIGTSILYVAAARIMAQWFRRREFGTLTGAWTSVANLGGIVAAAPLAALLPVIGWRASFAAIGVAVLFAALLVFLVVRNSPTDLGWPALIDPDAPVQSAPAGRPLAFWQVRPRAPRAQHLAARRVRVPAVWHHDDDAGPVGRALPHGHPWRNAAGGGQRPDALGRRAHRRVHHLGLRRGSRGEDPQGRAVPSLTPRRRGLVASARLRRSLLPSRAK